MSHACLCTQLIASINSDKEGCMKCTKNKLKLLERPMNFFTECRKKYLLNVGFL